MSEKNLQHQEILARIQEINDRLEPIYQTYQAWLTLGKWGKTVLYIAGAVLGLIVAWKQVFNFK